MSQQCILSVLNRNSHKIRSCIDWLIKKKCDQRLTGMQPFFCLSRDGVVFANCMFLVTL